MPNKIIKKKHEEHICRFNDGEQSCDCYGEGYDKGFIDGADQTGRIAEEELAIRIHEAKKEAAEEIVKILTKEHYGIDYKSDKCNECSNYDRINEVVKYLEHLEAKELLK